MAVGTAIALDKESDELFKHELSHAIGIGDLTSAMHQTRLLCAQILLARVLFF